MSRKLKFITALFSYLMLLSSCVTAAAVQTSMHEPFSGLRKDYTYRYDESQRDGLWEKDIIDIACDYLSIHPLLTDAPIEIYDAERYITYQYTQRLIASSREVYTDVNLKKAFIQAVEDLIQMIPALDDNAIIYRLVEIAAMIGDSHVRVGIPDGERFPFIFETFADGIFITSAPVAYEWALGAELLAVNGTDAGEAVARLSVLCEYESPYVKKARAPYLLSYPYALRHAGICNEDDCLTALFTLMCMDGIERVLAAEAIPPEAGNELEYVTIGFDEGLSLFNKYGDLQYFFEYLPDDDMLYIRYSRFHNEGKTYHQRNDYPYAKMNADIIELLTEQGGVDLFVIDVRGNHGGVLYAELMDLMYYLSENREIIGSVYVIIDTDIFSCGVIFPALIKTQVKDVLLIGEPGGQPPNSFYGLWSRVVFSSGVRLAYRGTGMLYELWPGYEYDTLMPDIYIPRLFSDYVKGVDAVLEYIRPDRE